MSFIQANIDKYTVKQMCSALKFPRGTYYAALNHVPSKREHEYAEIYQQILELKRQFPCIAQVMYDKAEVHLTTEEHVAFSKYLRLSRKLEDMERLQLYFRVHTDAVTYLKKIKAI